MGAREDREYYSRLVTGWFGRPSARVREAFASVPRERFVGPGPWRVFTPSGYVVTPSDDPAFLYQNVIVALAEDRFINNGEPSLHAHCMAALDPKPGETAVHVGAGTGYYTAILADLVGSSGHVDAYELAPDLAARTSANLADRPWVTVRPVSAVGTALPACDVLYVNAGATHPPDEWLDAVRPGGRLVLPLTPDLGLGALFLFEPRGRDFAVTGLLTAVVIGCEGARDAEMARRLGEACARLDFFAVKSLRRATPPDDSCWLEGRGWWLSRTPLPE
jgi:protein-L-isoaspartate(D-aspartate) O-methyltransferase